MNISYREAGSKPGGATRCRGLGFHLIVVVTVVPLGTLTARGEPFYSASAFAWPNPTQSANGSMPVYAINDLLPTLIGDAPQGSASTEGTAQANRGLLSGFGKVKLDSVNLGTGSITIYGEGDSTFRFDDFVITTSDPNPPAAIPVTVNMDLVGHNDASALLNNPGPGYFPGSFSSSVHLELNLQVNGQNFIGDLNNQSSLDVSTGGGTLTYTQTGILSGWNNGPLFLGPIMLPVNQHFNFNAAILSNATFAANIAGTGPEEPKFTAEATIDYKFQLQSRFTMPNGFTINSPEAGIENNNYMAPGVPGDYNDNGIVDMADYVLWRNGGPLQNEVASVGIVDAADYDAWRVRFGNTFASGSALPAAYHVPEPAGAVLFSFAALSIIAARRTCFPGSAEGN